MKKRIAVPRKDRDNIFREFNHSCALCGARNPQIHHLDENPSNNESLNLLPLCPNCHLSDQHNPTAPIDTQKLKLFRVYKDPAIMHPKFEPCFRRLRFLDEVCPETKIERLREDVAELVSFITALQMGNFYGNKIQSILREPKYMHAYDLHGDNEETYRAVRMEEQNYKKQVSDAREKVFSLAVEMLRYQDWQSPVVRVEKR